MAIKIEPLRKSFALANRLTDNPDIDMEQRKNYRSLESLIWMAFGEEMEAPAPAAERKITLNEQMEKIAPLCDRCNAGKVTNDTLDARAEYSKLLREASELVAKLGYF